MEIQKKVLCAVNSEKFSSDGNNAEAVEKFITKNVGEGFLVLDISCLYKEHIIEMVKNYSPDVLVVAEDIKGGQENILNILEKIKRDYDFCRIVIISKYRPKCDPFYKTLLTYGIYDCVTPTQTGELSFYKVIDKIRNKTSYKDFSLEFIDEDNELTIYTQKNLSNIGVINNPFSTFNKKRRDEEIKLDFSMPKKSLNEEMDAHFKKENIPEFNPTPKEEVNYINNIVIPEPVKVDIPKPIFKEEFEYNEKPNISKNYNSDVEKENMGFIFNKTDKEIVKEEVKEDSSTDEYPTTVLTRENYNDFSSYNNTVKTEEKELSNNTSFDTSWDNDKSLDSSNTNHLSIPEIQMVKVEEEIITNIKGFVFEKVKSVNPITEPIKSYPIIIEPAVVEEVKPLAVVKKGAKIITFTSAKEGCGVTSIVINTAYSLADKGKKVLVFDAIWDYPCIFDRFEIPDDSKGIDFAFNDYLKGQNTIKNNIVSVPSALEKDLSNNRRLKYFNKNVDFTKYSSSANFEDLCSKVGYLESFMAHLGSYYDYILIDLSIKDKSAITVKYNELADRVIFVTLQDLFELNLGRKLLNTYPIADLNKKMGIVINRYDSSSSRKMDNVLDHEAVCRHFGISTSIGSVGIDADDKGYTKAYLLGIPYYCMAGRKYRTIYDKWVNNITG